MDDDQQFCLRWNNHQSTLISVFDTLLENGTLVDCTLAAEGKFLKAHKVVLSACSPYFAALLQEQYDKHPIFILKDVKFQELRAMMDYMYRGEVNISQDQLAALLKAAESLQIKGLSDNRTGAAPRPDHHRGMNVPASNVSGATAVSGSGKMSGGYTLEQTKRARIGAAAMDTQEMSGSREGSSSPTRRRRKVRRRSIENAMTEVHDNSNSSQQPNLQQSNANLAGVGAITAAASVLASQQQPISGAALPTGSGGVATATQGTTQQLTTNVTKKTESVKVTSDAMNTENVQQTLGGDEQDMEHIAAVKIDKQNHKQKLAASASSTAAGKDASDLVIEPKSEYDEDGNDETVEDLTLDDEDMGMDDLDQNAGTSQGGEGSSQGYATWQHDRSQDELLLATQEAQQRDPQDLSNKVATNFKENNAPALGLIHKTNSRSILNTNFKAVRPHSRNDNNGSADTLPRSTAPRHLGNTRKRFSVNEVSDMLFELCKANIAKAPKNQQQSKYGQTSPASAETHEPSTIAAIATKSAAAGLIALSETASKNLRSDEMVKQPHPSKAAFVKDDDDQNKISPFHQSINYAVDDDYIVVPVNSLKNSMLVPSSPETAIKREPYSSPIKMTTSVIKPVPTALAARESGGEAPTAAIAAALIRDGYHSFQQQLRAQEILKHHVQPPKPGAIANTKILENFLRQQRPTEHVLSDNDGDDEDDSRLNPFDDIHLVEAAGSSSAKNAFNSHSSMPNLFPSGSTSVSSAAPAEYLSDESQKYMIAQAQAAAMRNLEYSLNDYPASTGGGNAGSGTEMENGEPIYECRHCGKRYRWKSTLRRHENVECGGKEPSHQCPYCSYRSKQRGNLGVHVRKHHSDLPQLASKRRSKYSTRYDTGSERSHSAMGGVTSEDSSSKLIIDSNK